MKDETLIEKLKQMLEKFIRSEYAQKHQTLYRLAKSLLWQLIKLG